MTHPAQEPMLDIAHGDPARSRFLREALGKLRSASDDKKFQCLVDEILAGRKSLREAARSDVFNSAVVDKVDEGARRYRELTEAEREQLAADGEQKFGALRDRLAQGGGRSEQDEDEDFGGSVFEPL